MYEYFSTNMTPVSSEPPGTADYWNWGIKRNTRNLRDYEAGKRIISTMDLTNDQYFQSVTRLADWVGV